jgi:hypothetical protein
MGFEGSEFLGLLFHAHLYTYEVWEIDPGILGDLPVVEGIREQVPKRTDWHGMPSGLKICSRGPRILDHRRDTLFAESWNRP